MKKYGGKNFCINSVINFYEFFSFEKLIYCLPLYCDISSFDYVCLSLKFFFYRIWYTKFKF